ncbi:protein disulfide isomerase [Blastocystis sp. ATCC 50177/Nand II]|uniref:Protein disulfide isomerase n=1 Tax=Blastocystis sp. subtype 1 (strain ATCC 50177 / NandII) TaxID=478820 RepID=A0A196S880_BLAHN|nr:protein disulfide isomerase [Blastocystis sp. ATCC 50177/Nand II]
MILSLLSLFLAQLCTASTMVKEGVNFLTKENLDYALTNNYTVLAMWNGNTCKMCLDEFWTIQGLFYSFQRESSFLVMANTMGVDEELDKLYHINIQSEYPEYRLFLRGSSEPADTFVHPDGGLNTLYGREPELDALAREFMAATDRGAKLAVMKKVVKLKNRYQAAYRYYKAMKILVRQGAEALQAELTAVQERREAAELFSKEYKKEVGMENVIRQFEAISLERAVVELTPYNFDFVVNGERDVLVYFAVEGCKPCAEFAPIFQAVAEANESGVVLARMDLSLYKSYARRYHIEAYPVMKWFAKGESSQFPYAVEVARTKEAIESFIQEQLHPEETEQSNPEEKETEQVNSEVKEMEQVNSDGKETEQSNPEVKETEQVNSDGKETEQSNPEVKETEQVNSDGKEEAEL